MNYTNYTHNFSPHQLCLSLRLLLFRELRGVESEIHRVPRAPAGGGLLGHLRGATGDGVGLSQGRSTNMGIVSKWLLSLSNFLVSVFALTKKNGWYIEPMGAGFSMYPAERVGSLGMILQGMIRPLEFPILL